jgi:molybdate transport system substrate-binding protein
MPVHVFSAGAAERLITHEAPPWLIDIDSLVCKFGAVGRVCELVADAKRRGAPCDVVILPPGLVPPLSRALHDELVVVGSLGTAATGIAHRADALQPEITSVDALRKVLLECTALYVPDMEKSTGGRHARSVLESLGLLTMLQPRLHERPGGAEAVAALAAVREGRPIAFAQATEVGGSSGVIFGGPLPGEFRLATEYVVCTFKNTSDPVVGLFAESLTGADAAMYRKLSGFAEIGR